MNATQGGSGVPKPPGLRRRGNSYGMRVRVPEHLRSDLPTEIVKSFGPVSYKEACRLAIIERENIARRFDIAEAKIKAKQAAGARIERSFDDAELTSFAALCFHELQSEAVTVPLYENAQRDLAESLREEAYSLHQPMALEDAGLQAFARGFAERHHLSLPVDEKLFSFFEAIRLALLSDLEQRIAALSGATVAPLHPALVGMAGTPPEPPSPTLAQAIELYVNAPERVSNTAKSRSLDRSRLRPMEDILGSDRSIKAISRADLRLLVDQLNSLPSNYTKIYPGKTAAEAIILGRSEGKSALSRTSVERNVQATKSLFRWLEREEIIDKSPAEHLRAPKAGKSTRRPYEPEEMNKLLAATSIAERGSRDWSYWTVRIAMLQGFRLTEPLGLLVGDFFYAGDVLAMRLRPNALRRLKNEATAREVPVHPRLIELGLEDLLRGRAADEPLIADTPRGDGKSFNAAQKQLMRIVRRSVSADRDLVIHSLRHSFRDEMRNKGFPRSVEEHLGGWKGEGSNSMDGYGRGHRLDILRDWIAKITFDGVSFA